VRTRASVKRWLPEAFCVRLADGSGYVVWPCRMRPRGFEPTACGFGSTARAAWASVQRPEPPTAERRER
jgi:hypothetical protein